MRSLTDEETKKLFDKLAQYIGANTTHLLERKGEEEHVFRLHKNRIWYMPLRLAKLASCVSKTNLMGIGVLFAKVTHNGNVRIQVTALEYIAQYSLFKIWLKPNLISHVSPPLCYNVHKRKKTNTNSSAGVQ